jgi:hypothetical protein
MGFCQVVFQDFELFLKFFEALLELVERHGGIDHVPEEEPIPFDPSGPLVEDGIEEVGRLPGRLFQQDQSLQQGLLKGLLKGIASRLLFEMPEEGPIAADIGVQQVFVDDGTREKGAQEEKKYRKNPKFQSRHIHPRSAFL